MIDSILDENRFPQNYKKIFLRDSVWVIVYVARNPEMRRLHPAYPDTSSPRVKKVGQ
jgi:hypothetical protein